MSESIVRCQQLVKSYHDGQNVVQVLKGFDFNIQPGERIAIIGRSGSGKSTLLHLLGGLDVPNSGQVFIQGTDWQSLREKQRCQVRNKQLGFVYQFHHLLPEFSALENVAMPLLLAGMKSREATLKSQNILDLVGLTSRISHKPAQLSGGERQRVAIARALVHQPSCILADEPTGNLDTGTAALVFDFMLKLNSQFNTALIVVTHDKDLAKRMDRVMILHEGVLHQQ